STLNPAPARTAPVAVVAGDVPVTVTVTASPAELGWPAGSIAVLSRHGGDFRHAITSGAARWVTSTTVRRYDAAAALFLAAGVHPDMTPVQIATAILAVADQHEDPWFAIAPGYAAETMARCATEGVRPTPALRRLYRRYWPDPTRAALCLALADRLLASTVSGTAVSA
ncbi:MAG TPA: hypothetical protein VEO01_03695, partial [Pseudonocardiaceae bacterium]|nr:hypothetical protein [Pseudonocardiaceae bacterium]